MFLDGADKPKREGEQKMRGPFRAASLEEVAGRPKPRLNIRKEINQIKEFIVCLRGAHHRQVSLLEVWTNNLERDCGSLKGMPQTLKRLKKFRKDWEKKYGALIAGLNKKRSLDALIKELDRKA